MNDDIETMIELLGDCDKQVNRIIQRKRYCCPKCREQCDGTHHYIKGKKAIDSDIELHCDSCGIIFVEVENSNDKKICRFKDTKDVCAVTANIKELSEIINNKCEDLEEYVNACDRLAEEIRYSGGSENELLPVYVKEMSVLLQNCKNTLDKNIIMMCEHTLDCNSIGKLELLDVLREVYRYVQEREGLIPKNLFYTLMVEKNLVSCVYDGVFGKPQDFLLEFDYYAELYSKLPDDEYLRYPSTPYKAYMYAIRFAEKEGLINRARSYLNKLIIAIEDYFDRGAKPDFSVVNNYVNAIRIKYPVITKCVVVFDKCRKRWKDNQYIVAALTSACAFDLMEYYVPERTKENINAIDKVISDRIIKYADEAIEVMESMEDIGRASVWLMDSYAIKGMLTDNDVDINMAIHYSILFTRTGLMRPDDFIDFAHEIEDYTDVDFMPDELFRVE